MVSDLGSNWSDLFCAIYTAATETDTTVYVMHFPAIFLRRSKSLHMVKHALYTIMYKTVSDDEYERKRKKHNVLKSVNDLKKYLIVLVLVLFLLLQQTPVWKSAGNDVDKPTHGFKHLNLKKNSTSTVTSREDEESNCHIFCSSQNVRSKSGFKTGE